MFPIAPLVAGRIVSTRTTGSAPDIVMTELSLTERARLIGGARYEDDQLTIDALLDARLAGRRDEDTGRTCCRRSRSTISSRRPAASLVRNEDAGAPRVS